MILFCTEATAQKAFDCYDAGKSIFPSDADGLLRPSTSKKKRGLAVSPSQQEILMFPSISEALDSIRGLPPSKTPK
ncbi:hypothetical protein SK128_012226, partial [Halocaridina rubra]